MWDKILPDELLIKVRPFSSLSSFSINSLGCSLSTIVHIFVRLFHAGDWLPRVSPGQLPQLGKEQLVPQLNQGSTWLTCKIVKSKMAKSKGKGQKHSCGKNKWFLNSTMFYKRCNEERCNAPTHNTWHLLLPDPQGTDDDDSVHFI